MYLVIICLHHLHQQYHYTLYGRHAWKSFRTNARKVCWKTSEESSTVQVWHLLAEKFWRQRCSHSHHHTWLTFSLGCLSIPNFAYIIFPPFLEKDFPSKQQVRCVCALQCSFQGTFCNLVIRALCFLCERKQCLKERSWTWSAGPFRKWPELIYWHFSRCICQCLSWRCGFLGEAPRFWSSVKHSVVGFSVARQTCVWQAEGATLNLFVTLVQDRDHCCEVASGWGKSGEDDSS